MGHKNNLCLHPVVSYKKADWTLNFSPSPSRCLASVWWDRRLPAWRWRSRLMSLWISISVIRRNQPLPIIDRYWSVLRVNVMILLGHWSRESSRICHIWHCIVISGFFSSFLTMVIWYFELGITKTPYVLLNRLQISKYGTKNKILLDNANMVMLTISLWSNGLRIICTWFS